MINCMRIVVKAQSQHLKQAYRTNTVLDTVAFLLFLDTNLFSQARLLTTHRYMTSQHCTDKTKLITPLLSPGIRGLDVCS